MITNPKAFGWVDPTDAGTIADGITGYTIGVRLTTDPGSVAGKYAITLAAPGATAASALFASLSPALAPGVYAAAIQTNTSLAGNSAWSEEVQFQITGAALPPTGFSVA